MNTTILENNINSQSNKIDEELYSRQIIFLGMETMEKISQLKILIIGLRGLGVEIAKNIIVSGPNKVTIFDPNQVQIKDLGSNFYLCENDIGKRRDKACIQKLKKLNKYVNVNYFTENNLDDVLSKIIGNYNVVIVSEIIQKKYILLLDDISRKNKICFIYSAVCGLSSFIFTDFGNDFIIHDEFCAKKRKFFIKNIEKSENGLVEIQWEKEYNPDIKEYIIFREVEGMTEINYNENNRKIFKIKSRDATSFYIGSTKNYSDYKEGGYIEETVLPKKVSYRSFKEMLEEPFTNADIYINPQKKFIFLVFRALMEFFDSNKRLPIFNNEKDFEQLKIITQNFYKNINYEKSKSFFKEELFFNEKLIENICFTASAEVPCMTSFVGGVVCQEIIKTTGKFRPIEQWEIFDFLQYSTLVPKSEKLSYNQKRETRYDELKYVFGKKIVLMLQNSNILLAGAGALGCELLKNLALFGISSSGSILTIDDDNIEISNLNRQFLFHEEHKGKSKACIACRSAKEINNDLICSYISKRISPENKDIFNKSYFKNVDFVLGAIDSNQGNYYLVKQCELYDKIFIKGGTGGPAGKIETFIPQMTCSYNNIKYVGPEEDKLPSCTRREFPGKIEDCIDNARDLFDEYFVTIVDDILNIINNKEKLLQLEVENDMNKFNLIIKFIHFIKNENNKINKNKFNNVLDLFKKRNSKNENERKNKLEKDLITFGLKEFEKLFVKDIEKIYSQNPLNDTEASKSFWNNKRQPSELHFEIEDELCLNFLFNFLKIMSKLLGIEFLDDIKIFEKKTKEVLNTLDKENSNSNKDENNIILVIKEPEILYNKVLEEINEIKKNSLLLNKIKNLQKVDFEKDIPELGHIQFVHSYANLKAKCYKIPCCNKFYTLEYVGKIAPTTITSTAVVGGFMCLQLIGIIINQLYIWPLKGHLLNEKDKMDDIDDEELIENGLHNLCFNLKNNEFAFEPLQEVEYDGNWNINNLIPEKYSRWLKIIEGGNKTINEFIQYIKEKYEVNVTLILSAEDDRDIFELISPKRKNKKAREKKLLMDKIYNLKVEDVYFDTARNICKNYNKENEIFLKIKGITDTAFYTEFPVINYKI